MTAIPARLFKYEPPTLQTLRNLKTQTIFFGSPLRFNDPYDCAVAPRVKAPTSEQVARFRLSAEADERLPLQARRAMASIHDEQLAEMLIRQTSQVVQLTIDNFLSTKGVTCFSESNESLLMWSHYAGRGQGICLEFDTSFSPFEKVLKVDYPAEAPAIDLTQPLLDGNFDQVDRLYCTKSIHWSYEREWRGIHAVANTSFTYDAKCLRAVYFGTEVERDLIDIICLILQGQNEYVRFFQASRKEFSYGLDFHEFSYTNHRQATKLKTD
jgi:hypothetical protein